MGTVYLATQESLERDVCLKTLNASRSESGEYFERFLNEGRIVAGLRHPHIITIYDIGASDDVVYIAMEYVDGGDLKERLDEPMEPNEALDILIKVAGALDFAHGEGIIHRDVKPANILFHRDGEPLLSDFGIAKQVRIDSELTSTGTILGSPFYMSPEQSEGLPVDGRADIYSLGIILYEMLVGERPYIGDSPIKIIMQHLQKPIPVLPSQLARYQTLLNLMIAKDRNERFPDAGALVDYIVEKFGDEIDAKLGRVRVPTEPVEPMPEPTRRTGRSRLLYLALGLGVCVVTALGLLAYVQSLGSASIVSRHQSQPSGTIEQTTNPASSPLAQLQAGVQNSGKDAEISRTIAAANDPAKMRANVVKAMKWLGEHSLAQGKLTSPPADNALYYYSRVLALNPGDPDARAGFRAIGDRYVALAERQFAARNDLQAQVYIQLGLQVDPDNDGLRALNTLVAERQQSSWGSLFDLFRWRS